MSTSDDTFVATGPAKAGFLTQAGAQLNYGVTAYGKSIGIVGSSDAVDAPAIFGRSGSPGPSLVSTTSTAPSPGGICGTSRDRNGVVGTSKAAAGVVGYSSDYVGVVGIGGFSAGIFFGNVSVSGALTAGTKNAMVPFPDGSQRLLHCMESPEHWFEDFGSARLRRGRAAVKLDRDFAKVIKRDAYRVFLVAEGDCNGLYVHRKGRHGFEVRELQGGGSSVAFSYRIVARRKDIEGHKRFAKADLGLPLPGRKPAATRGRKAKSLPSSMRAAGRRA